MPVQALRSGYRGRSGWAGILREVSLDVHASYVLIVVMHDFSVVVDLADRFVAVEEGRIVEPGLTPDVLKAPDHEVTRAPSCRPEWPNGESLG